ncbi:hypothetical protein CNMCM8694_001820 [Aspergillus lentulus]|nr:hypothetical protein CNMCM8694_001820 [Aspergillus lentulus]
MRIIDPQSAVLTNIEVLAYITANPPRRPPNPPPNSRNWVPSPDLRDHNTVVREVGPPPLWIESERVMLTPTLTDRSTTTSTVSPLTSSNTQLIYMANRHSRNNSRRRVRPRRYPPCSRVRLRPLTLRSASWLRG